MRVQKCIFLIENGKLIKRFRYMECNKNFMPMILSESHKESNECKRIEIFNNRIENETLPMAAVRNIGQ